MRVSIAGKERIYQSALGIATGDVVTTSYSTGPYEVWSIAGPRFVTGLVGEIFIRDFPVVSLTLIKLGGPENDHFWINRIRQEGARWFTDANDEVYVEKASAGAASQLDMFASSPALPAPYTFDPDVDYRNPYCWHCRRCKRDFNAPARRHGGPLEYCPACDECGWITERIHFVEREDLNQRLRGRGIL